MKTLILVLLFFSVAAQAQFQNTIAFKGASSTVPSGGGSTCSQFAKAAGTFYDDVSSASVLSQAFTTNKTVKICAINKANGHAITSTSAHYEIRTAVNGGGSLLASSDTITPSGAWATDTYPFTVPYEVTSNTTVYITYVGNGSPDYWQISIDIGPDPTGLGLGYEGSTAITVGHNSNASWIWEVDTEQ